MPKCISSSTSLPSLPRSHPHSPLTPHPHNLSHQQAHAASLPTTNTTNTNTTTTYRLRRPVAYALLGSALLLFALTVEGARSAYTDNPPPWYVPYVCLYVCRQAGGQARRKHTVGQPPALVCMHGVVKWHTQCSMEMKFYLGRRTSHLPLRILILPPCRAHVHVSQSIKHNHKPHRSQARMSAYIALSKPAWTVGLALLCFCLFLGTDYRSRGYGTMGV